MSRADFHRSGFGRQGVPPGGTTASARDRQRAFTLIELLLVVGLIVLLTGAIGLALTDTRGAALKQAQAHLASLCATARTAAILHQSEARLVIHATSASGNGGDACLRLLQVFVRDPSDETQWSSIGEPVLLPRGIALVPNSPGALAVGGSEWPAGLGSAVESVPRFFSPTEIGWAGATTVLFVEFGADGTARRADGQAQLGLFVSPVTSQPGTSLVQFNQPSAVRGIIVRPSGAVSWINGGEDAAGI